MKEMCFETDGIRVRVIQVHTVVLGTGAAGYNAADCLYDEGQRDVALVTEGVCCGTSRNTGSDKQTYYKLSLGGGDADSVRAMAGTLYAGRCVDGDLALCEAALSAKSFFKLASLGVPFPCNRYGEYVGYKTDHDPYRRATSVGPYTSRRMTECLQEATAKKGIPVFDGMLAISILKDPDGACAGLLCLDTRGAADRDTRYAAFLAENTILATGGPAGMYACSVYPASQHGAAGLAFAAGVRGKNLTEWQFGLASVKPRWNVSGTYMQCIPRFVSIEADGSDPREFLEDVLTDDARRLTAVFLKGYQWPFDVRKVANGSSVIDILVYLEQKKGRRVFLDFTHNPGCGEIPYERLGAEAREYLEKAGACFGTPIDRLERMNAPAVAFYREHGIDLHRDWLEIALCAQHNNGGLAVDCWWQTNIAHLFCVGEAAGTHGVYRPGGSALNAGQVGAMRAARFIAHQGAAQRDPQSALPGLACALRSAQGFAESVLHSGREPNVARLRASITGMMSELAGAFRSEAGLCALLKEIGSMQSTLADTLAVRDASGLAAAFRLKDMLIAQRVYAHAMLDYLRTSGASRGSALYTRPGAEHPVQALPEMFIFALEDADSPALIQEIWLDGEECRVSWREPRPLPEDDDFFENVWRSFRENGNVC